MDKSLQQKLVGAAVLIALAVIFVPMLFDGKKEAEPVSVKIDVPPKPVYDIPNRLPPVPPPDLKAEAPSAPAGQAPAAEPAPAQPAVPAPRAEAPEPAKPAKPTPPAEAAKPVKSAETAAAGKAPAPRATSAAPKPAPPPAPAAASGKAGYVVQVGSFSKRGNADGLKARLAKRGYRAFVETVRGRNGTIYRVKVGPRPSRDEADALRQRLIDEEKLQGIIVGHH